MSRPVLVLAASVLTMIGTALHYRNETMVERARVAQPGNAAPAAAAAASLAIPVPAAIEPAPGPSRAPANVRTAAVESAPDAPTAPQAQTRAAARAATPSTSLRDEAMQFLVKYEDPAARAGLLRSASAQARADLAGFDRERGLDRAKFEKLIELQAAHVLEQWAAQYRCAAYPDCSAYQDDSWERHIQAVDALIGQGGYLQTRSWTQSLPVRRIVNSFARHLPPSASLTRQQTNALIDDFEEERRRHLGGYSDSRQHYRPYINAQGMEVLYSRDASTLDDRMASARAYSHRVRDDAAAVLNGRQLATFNQMQDKALMDLRAYLVMREARTRTGS